MNLLAGLYSQDDLRRYFIRQRCSPQPGMRCVEKSARSYVCWLYEGYAWNRHEVVRDRAQALEWWLGDPWLPNQQFEYGVLADRADIGHALACDRSDELPARRWEEAAAALAFQAATQTGVRPHEVGPDSTETGAVVYRAAAGPAGGRACLLVRGPQQSGRPARGVPRPERRFSEAEMRGSS